MMTSLSPVHISLDAWQLVRVSGADNQKYLQGQVTADMDLLTEQHALFAAHCDAKGKMWSNLLLFKRGNDIYYIVRKSVITKQIAALKKYAIFSKITIEIVNDLTMFGLVGEPIPQHISTLFANNNCITHENTTYIKLAQPTERIIVINPAQLPTDLLPSQHWVKLDLEAGYAIIDEVNMESLLPQACNIQLHDAISFTKGCYCGQEMVARAQFRGANKRALYLLVGQGSELPIIGDTLECQIGENWRESGQILAALELNTIDETYKTIYVQAVLNNSIESDAVFRLKGQPNSKLTLNNTITYTQNQ